MPHNRFFIDHPFQIKEKIFIEDQEFHHMKVMRCQENEQIELINGNHQLAEGIILNLGKKKAEILIEKVTKNHPTKKYILAQSNLRFSKLEWILEKATELGITDFWIFASDRSEKKKLSDQQKKRAQAILISAIKQCARLDLPRIQEFPSIYDLPNFSGKIYLAHPNPKACKLINEKPTETDILLVIGPEKGFTKQELDFFKDQPSYKQVKLSEHILRAETAAICATSIGCLL